MAMTAKSPFDTQLFGWIEQRYDAIDDYVRLF